MSTIILYLILQQWLKGDNEKKEDFKRKNHKEEAIDKRILFPIP